jgi:cell division protein FtsQ
MHQRISKKIVIYLSLFFILVIANNIDINRLNFTKINSIEVLGLGIPQNNQIKKDINQFESKNLFFLSKLDISQKIYSNEIVEKFTAFKNYPSKLRVEIKKTQLLAVRQIDGYHYFIGSNGKLIKKDNFNQNLPFIFGNVDNQEFLRFKETIDNSKFRYSKIKNLYFFKSNRWDIETHEGYLIKLPKKNLESTLNLLVKLLGKEQFKSAKIIDFRQLNQIVINEL